MKKYTLKALCLVLLMAPVDFVMAAPFNGIQDLILQATLLVGLLLPLTASIALLYFFWGMVKFIRDSGSDDGRAAGKQTMIWGIVALFCIIAVWGLVTFIREALGIEFIQDIFWPSLNR